MAWKVWCDTYETSAELSNGDLFNTLIPQKNLVLRYVRASIVYVGSPSFTDLKIQVWANDNENGPAKTELLVESETSFDSTRIVNLGNGVADVWWRMPEFHVKQGVSYNFTPVGSSYFPTATSYIGLEKEYPNPIHKKGYTPSTINIPNAPYKIYTASSPL